MKDLIIIAEAGVNHNGQLDLAKKLIDAASNSCADFIKFQTFKSEKLVSESAPLAEYQKSNLIKEEKSQLNMLKRLELSEEDHHALFSYCKDKEVGFLSTPFDCESADFLEPLVPLYKISSGDLTNIPFLKYLASKKKPMIISTGMATMNEVLVAVNSIYQKWDELGLNKKEEESIFLRGREKRIPWLSVLHCTTEYPTPLDEINLNAILTLRKQLSINIGYSDHTLGYKASEMAVALGSTIIEKHFTLDKKMDGPDHLASLNPEELNEFVRTLNECFLMLGDGVKKPAKCEEKNIFMARKSLHYNRNLSKGELLKSSDIIIKRPQAGILPSEYDKILGKKLARNVNQDQAILLEDLVK